MQLQKQFTGQRRFSRWTAGTWQSCLHALASSLLFWMLLQAPARLCQGQSALPGGWWSFAQNPTLPQLPSHQHPAQLQPQSTSSCSNMVFSSCHTTPPMWVPVNVLGKTVPFQIGVTCLCASCQDSRHLQTVLCQYLQEDASLTRNWQKTVRVAVTGASGQIANHLLFMVSPLLNNMTRRMGHRLQTGTLQDHCWYPISAPYLLVQSIGCCMGTCGMPAEVLMLLLLSCIVLSSGLMLTNLSLSWRLTAINLTDPCRPSVVVFCRDSLHPVRCLARTSPSPCSCWAASAPVRPWRVWPWSWRTACTHCFAR